jgi:hypothetical protein
MAFWGTIIASRGLSHPTQKGAKLPLLSEEGCHTRLDGQHCPLITYQGIFFKASDDINTCLFLMYQKGLYKNNCFFLVLTLNPGSVSELMPE